MCQGLQQQMVVAVSTGLGEQTDDVKSAEGRLAFSPLQPPHSTAPPNRLCRDMQSPKTILPAIFPPPPKHTLPPSLLTAPCSAS